MAKCNTCGADVAKGATCPHCGKDSRSFFSKHKFLTGLLIIMIVGILGSALGGDGDNKEDGKLAAHEPSDSNTGTEEDPDDSVGNTEEGEKEEEVVANVPLPVIENTDTATLGEKNAYRSASNYLNFTAFSYTGLVKQLEFEGFSHEEAIYGVEKCNANWNDQAEASAKNYLDFTAFSYTGLISQLEFEGFTHEEAVYGADRCEADWNEQAAIKAQEYLDFSSFSRADLINQLEFEGFTSEQASYGVQAVGY